MKIISLIWEFFQNQILGMKWLNELIGLGLSSIGINISSKLGESVQFFLYDTVKLLFFFQFLFLLFHIYKAIFLLNVQKRY